MQKIRKNSILLICQFILIYSSWINIFPEGYSFNGQDIIQYIDFPRLLNDLNFLWNSRWSEGTFVQYYSYQLFYWPFYLLSRLFNCTPSQQSFFYFIIFLSGSFWSFYYSSQFFETTSSKDNIYYEMRIVLSLLYAYNLYTLRFFSFVWGYTPAAYLYLVIPLIFGYTYKYFNTSFALRNLPPIVIVFFLLNLSNGNLPYFYALNILLLLYAGYFFSITNEKMIFFKKFLTYYFAMFISTFWTTVPMVREMIRINQKFIHDGSIFKLSDWLLWQAVKFPHSLFGVEDLGIYMQIFTPVVLILSCVLLVLAFSTFLMKEAKHVPALFLGLFIFTIFLLNKGIGILPHDVILKIFSMGGLASLRSYDKTMIFLPYFILIIILHNPLLKKRIIYFTLIVTCLVSCYPFFTGGIQTKYSIASTYQSSDYWCLNTIPEEYIKFSKEQNKKKLNQKILRCPYSVINSPGWMNLPRWKLLGVDPTAQFFNNSNVYMNSWHNEFGTWNYGEIWNKQSFSESIWILKFMPLLNTHYLLYQKDCDQRFIQQTKSKIDSYLKNNLIQKVYDNDFFSVYKNNYLLPQIYTPKKIIYTPNSIDTLPDILLQKGYDVRTAIYFLKQNYASKLLRYKSIGIKESDLPILEVKKINPIKYRIRVHQAHMPFPLIFGENYHPDWKLYLTHLPKENKILQSDISHYIQIDGNNEEQVSKEQLKEFIKSGWITTLGKLPHSKNNLMREKGLEINKEETKDDTEKTINYISENISGTIQNDNLPDSNPFETCFSKSIEDNQTHTKVNGYANSWLVDPKMLCDENPDKCIIGTDGNYDFELIIEFWPQRLYYLGIFVSWIPFIISIIYLCCYVLVCHFRKVNK